MLQRKVLALSLLIMTLRSATAAPPRRDAGEQLTPWTAQADPAKGSMNYAKDIRLTLPAGVGDSFIVANLDRQPQFLAVAIMRGGPVQSWTLIDLITGKSTPSLSERMWLEKNAILSPDGEFLAGMGADLPSGRSFQIWSMKQKKRIVNIKVDVKGDTPTRPITFLDAGHVLTRGENLMHTTMLVVDVATGKIDRRLAITERMGMADDPFAVSPGGKYFVAVAPLGPRLGQGIFIVDLESGKTVGQSQVPAIGHFQNAGTPKGIAFSNDGKEIAVAFDSGIKRRLIVWDAANGKVTSDFPDINFSEMDTVHRPGSYLEFAPNGKTLRMCRFIIDRKTGETIETISPPPGESGEIPFVTLLGDNTAITSSQEQLFHKACRLTTVPLKHP